MIDTIILGNTGTYTIVPDSLILGINERSSINPSDEKPKDFLCAFLGDLFF